MNDTMMSAVGAGGAGTLAVFSFYRIEIQLVGLPAPEPDPTHL